MERRCDRRSLIGAIHGVGSRVHRGWTKTATPWFLAKVRLPTGSMKRQDVDFRLSHLRSEENLPLSQVRYRAMAFNMACRYHFSFRVGRCGTVARVEGKWVGMSASVCSRDVCSCYVRILSCWLDFGLIWLKFLTWLHSAQGPQRSLSRFKYNWHHLCMYCFIELDVFCREHVFCMALSLNSFPLKQHLPWLCRAGLAYYSLDLKVSYT